MTSERKIEANRRNAARSTGPRTPEGKRKVSLNAVKHGLTATTIVVLPHEDAEAYERRLQAWTAELNPKGDLDRYLAERAVKVSWQLDRADSYEQACLARRVRRAEREIDEGGGAEAAALLKTLYETPDEAWQSGLRQDGPRMSSAFDHLSGGRREAPAAESPASLIRKLEATAGGCRRLLGEWDRLREKAVAATRPDPVLGWDWDEMRCAFRLLGLCQDEVKVAAAFDRRLGLLAKVYAVVEDRACRKILRMGCDDDPEDHPPPGGPDDEAEPPLPFDLAEVNGEFRAIAEEQCARLRPILARHEEEERDNRDDLPRRVSFDDSAEGERVHRYQAHWSRMLLRTLAELRNHRELPVPEARPEPATGAVPPSPSVELPAPQLDVAVPSSSASSPQPVPVIPPPVAAPPASTTAEATLRNKPTVDESTSETTGVYVEVSGESKPTRSGTKSTVSGGEGGDGARAVIDHPT